MGQIYGIRRIDINKIVYIGQTINNYKKRWQQHKQQAKERTYALYHAMNKYGIENFEPILIEDCDDEHLNERETHWIKFYCTYIDKAGYNLTYGGDTPPLPEGIEVHQYSLSGEYIQSYSSLSEAARMFGVSSSSIWKAVHGELNQTHGFRWSLNKVPLLTGSYKPHKTQIRQCDLNGNFIADFDSLRAAALSLNKPNGSSNIRAAATGKRNTAYGYKWELID